MWRILLLSYLVLGLVLGLIGSVFVRVMDKQWLPWWYPFETAIAWPYLLLAVLFD